MGWDVCLERCYPEPLLAIASYGLAAPSRVLPTRPLPEGAWPAVLAAANSNRLLGLLCAAIEDGALPATPEQLNQARQLQMSVMAWAMRLENDLLAVLDLLTASAIDVRVLKGSGVAHLDYSDPALRSFIDLDVLVRSEQIDRAVELLTRAGFQRRHPQPRPGFDRRFSKGTTFLSSTGYELDLHRTFVEGSWGLMINLDDLWDDGEEFEVGGRILRALCLPARFMHACYHAALGDWPPRLSSLRDVAQMLLVIGQNERDLRALAARWRAEAVLAVAVSDAWSLLGVAKSTATSVWAQVYVPTDRDKARLALYRHGRKTSTAQAVSALSAISGLRDKAAFVRALVLPEAHYIHGRHSSAIARFRYGIAETRQGRGGRP
ncbi:MAG: hypothetical protein DLM61_19835 [Pseudonocardiales bacterium]|nr:MAG: hypothetical protein DLM61_19835 [Pseudonocardiales bacterium]